MIYLQTRSYNLDIAKTFGIHTAVFLACIDDEIAYQTRLNNITENGTISLSRGEIYERTALDDDKQLDVEIALQEVGVIAVKPVKNVPNKNYYILNPINLINILESDNPSDIIGDEKAKQFLNQPRIEPISKRQNRITQMKKKITVEDPVIQDYLCQWIDAVHLKPKGFLSPSGVVIAQEELLAYAKDNQEKQIAILKIAIKGGLRDLSWAIEQYEAKQGSGSRNFASYDDIKADANTASDEVF